MYIYIYILILILKVIRATTHRACSHGQGTRTKANGCVTTPITKVRVAGVCSPHAQSAIGKTPASAGAFKNGVKPSIQFQPRRERITEGLQNWISDPSPGNIPPAYLR